MDDGSLFEITMKMFWREKAYDIASYGNNIKQRGRKEWYRKTIKQMMKDVVSLDTTEEHRQRLMGALEIAEECIKDVSGQNLRMIDSLFIFCGLLLGYTYQGIRAYTLLYWQNEDQFFSLKMLKDGSLSLKNEKEDAMTKRIMIVKQLQKEGLSHFKIALVLNVSEYKVKKMLKA